MTGLQEEGSGCSCRRTYPTSSSSISRSISRRTPPAGGSSPPFGASWFPRPGSQPALPQGPCPGKPVGNPCPREGLAHVHAHTQLTHSLSWSFKNLFKDAQTDPLSMLNSLNLHDLATGEPKAAQHLGRRHLDLAHTRCSVNACLLATNSPHHVDIMLICPFPLAQMRGLKTKDGF